MDIFASADAMASVIWSTCLATVVMVILVKAQRILNIGEVIRAWIEGAKDVMEPMLILLLAWALGDVINVSAWTLTVKENHMNVYICYRIYRLVAFFAQVLKSSNISAKYVPAITTVIGYFMAYCTGAVSIIYTSILYSRILYYRDVLIYTLVH